MVDILLCAAITTALTIFLVWSLHTMWPPTDWVEKFCATAIIVGVALLWTSVIAGTLELIGVL